LLENETISEVIESCERRIIHVDNPPIDVEDEEDRERNRKKRKDSRSILLKHLKTCTDSYRPRSLDEINEKINEYVIEKEKSPLKEELDEVRVELTSVKSNLEGDESLTQELLEQLNSQLKRLEERRDSIEGRILENNKELVDKAMKELLREKGLFEFVGKKLDNAMREATNLLKEELHHFIETSKCLIM